MLSVFHHHMHMYSNPFTMGCMAMNPRANFFLGLACATSPMGVTPFMGSIFTTVFGGFQNAIGYSNPFAFNNMTINNNNFNFNFNSSPANNNFVYSTPAFGSLTTGNMLPGMPPVLPSIPSFKFSFPTFNFLPTNTTSSDTSYKASSKLKPGLLKGNLKGKEGVITELCQKYNVDIALVVSIIGQESGFGTSNLAQHNNFMGYRAAGDLGKSSNGFGYFSTPEKGLEAAIRNISKYPERYSSVKKADMNNIDAIGKIYCEGDSYATAIKKIYNTTVKEYLA